MGILIAGRSSLVMLPKGFLGRISEERRDHRIRVFIYVIVFI